MKATGVSRGISKVSETLRLISSTAHLSLILGHNCLCLHCPSFEMNTHILCYIQTHLSVFNIEDLVCESVMHLSTLKKARKHALKTWQLVEFFGGTFSDTINNCLCLHCASFEMNTHILCWINVIQTHLSVFRSLWTATARRSGELVYPSCVEPHFKMRLICSWPCKVRFGGAKFDGGWDYLMCCSLTLLRATSWRS